ncbi:transcriptional regulator [Bacillus wudalianchiensis]|uniref:Transcriptional regulator n=2 Tax=Pseudobacillus wudalianchiensis TaxID=1743143 RepID=A0A1B9AZE6_9BACI|nr:transcriptional regulator [Bacillus wudalianchiensis]
MSEQNEWNCSQKKHTDKATICDNFHHTIEFIGKRWMGIIIYTLLKGDKRYHELLNEIPGISDRLLTERLRELENEGLVVKKAFESSPRKVIYSLTPIGRELEDVITAVMRWVSKASRI